MRAPRVITIVRHGRAPRSHALSDPHGECTPERDRTGDKSVIIINYISEYFILITSHFSTAEIQRGSEITPSLACKENFAGYDLSKYGSITRGGLSVKEGKFAFQRVKGTGWVVLLRSSDLGNLPHDRLMETVDLFSSQNNTTPLKK